MTDQEKQATIRKIVIDFTHEYLERRLLWQLGQIVPGADDVEPARHVLIKLYEDAPDALQHTMEPQEWFAMAMFGEGLSDEDPGEMREVCQQMAEWIFGIPGIYSYTIPDQWAETEMGALWWKALLRCEGDELITLAEAAQLAGVTLQAMSQRVTRGKLRSFIDPLAGRHQGRRLVRRSEVKNA